MLAARGCQRRLHRDRLASRLWYGEQLAGSGDVVGALGAGEQAVVADAVEALGSTCSRKRRMNSRGVERHGLVAVGTLGAVVLVAEA